MSDAAKKILAQFDALSDGDQRWLVDVLVARVRGTDDEGADDDGEVSEEWNQEIARRIERLRSGEAKTIPWAEVEARIKKSLSEI